MDEVVKGLPLSGRWKDKSYSNDTSTISIWRVTVELPLLSSLFQAGASESSVQLIGDKQTKNPSLQKQKPGEAEIDKDRVADGEGRSAEIAD